MGIVVEGLIIGTPFLALGVILYYYNHWVSGILFFLLGAFILFFFRDPTREIPNDPKAIVSPADGKIVLVEECEEEKVGITKKISIFMSLFDVHINRIPFDGTVIYVKHIPGKFFRADKTIASIKNERNEVLIKSSGDKLIKVIQVAGLIARRIVCHLKPGQKVNKGERFGMIRFGSRVDIFLPYNTKLIVKKGEKVKGGETILGYME